MVGLVILGVLVGLIVLILLIPVGADIGYENGELHVSAKVMGILLQLFPKPPADPNKPPKKKKEKKPKKEKKKKEPPKEEEQQPKKKRKLNFTADELLELVKVALRGFGKFGRKFKVDRFVLRYTAAGQDPYNVAVAFGWVNAALSGLAPLCRQRFTVKDCEVRTDVDFTAEWMHLDLGIAMTIRIGQILGTVLGIGFGALRILLRSKRRVKREAKLNPPERTEQAETPAEEAAAPADQTDKNETKIDEATAVEERKNSNG